VIQGHGDESTNKFEIMQMVRVNKGRSVDLEAVVVLVGVLEQAVHWVQHLMGQQKEPFPCYSSIVKAFLSSENNI
jgi:hypothetical protein